MHLKPFVGMCLLLGSFMCGCSISCSYTTPARSPNYNVRRMPFMDFLRARTVLIKVKSTCKDSLGMTDTQTASGTGVILESRPSGSYVLTARHVVHEPGVCTYVVDVAQVKEDNTVGRFYRSKILIKSDSYADLAVIRVPKDFGVSTRFVRRLRVGIRAHSLGFPSVLMSTSKRYWTYTDGALSTIGISRGGHDYVAYTTKVFFGNSGGGVWTDRGELVGLATRIHYSTRLPYAAYYGPSVKAIKKFLKSNGYGYLIK